MFMRYSFILLCPFGVFGLWRKDPTVQEKWRISNKKVLFDIDAHFNDEVRHYILREIRYMNKVQPCMSWEQVLPWVDLDTKDMDYKVTFRNYHYYMKESCSTGISEQLPTHIYIGDKCLATLVGYHKEGKWGQLILRQMMHAMGFYNEHNRWDRNCYLSLISGAKDLPQYRQLPANTYFSDYPYDLFTTLHWATWQKGTSRAIMRSLNENITEIGRQDGYLSLYDISKIHHRFCGEPSFCDSIAAGPIEANGRRKACNDIAAEKELKNCA